ncbi:hypothetical protein F4810DRAFT_676070, partial [Camillea tinctor]
MPYRLHPYSNYTTLSRPDDDYAHGCLTYDNHTNCTACHKPAGLLRILRAIFGGPRTRCRHHQSRRRAGSGWEGNVKGWARRKGCVCIPTFPLILCFPPQKQSIKGTKKEKAEKKRKIQNQTCLSSTLYPTLTKPPRPTPP